jgi:hypothetical protein
MQGHTIDFSVTLFNDGINPLPVVDRTVGDPDVKIFAAALFGGDDPYVALKKDKKDKKTAENDIEQIVDDSGAKTFKDLTVAAQKKVTKIVKEYHTVMKQSLERFNRLAEADSDVKAD